MGDHFQNHFAPSALIFFELGFPPGPLAQAFTFRAFGAFIPSSEREVLEESLHFNKSGRVARRMGS